MDAFKEVKDHFEVLDLVAELLQSFIELLIRATLGLFARRNIGASFSKLGSLADEANEVGLRLLHARALVLGT